MKTVTSFMLKLSNRIQSDSNKRLIICETSDDKRENMKIDFLKYKRQGFKTRVAINDSIVVVDNIINYYISRNDINFHQHKLIGERFFDCEIRTFSVIKDLISDFLEELENKEE